MEFPPPPAPPPPPPRPVPPRLLQPSHNSFNKTASSQQYTRNASNSAFSMPVSASLDQVSTFRSVDNFKSGGLPLVSHADHRRVPSTSRTTVAILPQPPQQSPNSRQKNLTPQNFSRIFIKL